MPQNKVITFLDALFAYMPPIQKAAPQAAPHPAIEKTVKPLAESVNERLAAGRPVVPNYIPGIVGPGGLSPEQVNAVLARSPPALNADMLTPQLKSIADKALKGGLAAGGSALVASSGSVTTAASAAASAAGPAIVLGADALGIGIAVVDMLGGDVSIPTDAASLSDQQKAQLKVLASQGIPAARALAMVEGRTGQKSIMVGDDYYKVGGSGIADTSEPKEDLRQAVRDRPASRFIRGE